MRGTRYGSDPRHNSAETRSRWGLTGIDPASSRATGAPCQAARQAVGARETALTDDNQREGFRRSARITAVPRACTESFAKVGVAGSNPVVRSKQSWSAPREGR